MPSDIRSFFAPKGGGSSQPAKPAPRKAEEAKGRRGKGRKVVEDSDEDEDIKQPPNPLVKKQKKADASVEGVTISADDYFASSKMDTPKSTPRKQPPAPMKTELQVRQSPRLKKEVADPPKPTKKESADSLKPGKTAKPPKAAPRRVTSTYAAIKRGHEDAYMEDGDEDGDDIFAADIKGRSKRKNGDYVDDDSDDDLLPHPKRVASRSRKPVKEESDDEKLAPSRAAKGRPSAAKKRKTPASDSEGDFTDEAPKKKPAAKKARAPAKKKDDAPENADYQSIIDSIPTIRPSTPEPQDGKFDFKKHAMGGGNAAPPPNPTAELPTGEDGCLTGLTFVFTGQLQTIGREEGQALVKQYGGKVTGQPSSKTSYVVLGDAAGPSKIAKIKSHDIKTINEEGLFELVRKLPAHGGSGKGAEKAREKQKAEEAKIKQQALEMEKEEKARKAQAERDAKKAASARGVTAAPAQTIAQLWTTKYAPSQVSHICGNKKNVEMMQEWLRNWDKARKFEFQRRGASGMGGVRAIIISGPPGIGKTTSAHLAANLEGYDVIESNASDTRSKKLVENGITDVLDNTSLLGYFAGDGKKINHGKKKIVLVMDEVDGMSAGDRGGVGALAKLCKKTEVPLILICNDRRLPKMKPFDFVTHDIKFTRPTVDQIRSRIMTICHREGLKLPVPVIDSLIEGSGKDIRQIINMLSTIKVDQSSMNFDKSKEMTKSWEKHVILKPWDITQKLLGGGMFGPGSTATLNDKIELYFNDHEFTPLMIQENYLKAKPMHMMGKHGYTKREANLKSLELFGRAAESISDGDLIDRMIHGPQQHWSLMPTHAIFSTVRPASLVSGQLLGCQFTSWLGNNSKTGKLGRYVREIHSHMRLRCSGDHNEVRQQYLPVIYTQTVKRMGAEGKDAVKDVIDLMDDYFLTRDDFDAIAELSLEGEVSIDSQAKSTFTRTYNGMHHPLPFMKASNIVAPKKQAKEVPDLEEAIEEEDDGADEVDPNAADDEDDLKKDKYIKQPKKKAAPKKKTARKADDDEGDEKPKKGRGRSAAKGRGKK
ncbi:Replication factor C subunit 1 [Zalerion maritima]|uniref:Replication factor C subunit 1 n=1 Tax=Zalerion maritima TaxID=339359 RepID=A0AAD5RGT9_9PEZI|nr:Replication factor C subunit 1 [Zalerion maritima]